MGDKDMTSPILHQVILFFQSLLFMKLCTIWLYDSMQYYEPRFKIQEILFCVVGILNYFSEILTLSILSIFDEISHKLKMEMYL